MDHPHHDFSPSGSAEVILGEARDFEIRAATPPMDLTTLLTNGECSNVFFVSSILANSEELLGPHSAKELDLVLFSRSCERPPTLPVPKMAAPTTEILLRGRYSGFVPPGYMYTQRYVLVVHFCGTRPRPR